MSAKGTFPRKLATLATLGLALGQVAMTCAPGVLSRSGAVMLIAAPDSVEEGVLENDALILAFTERLTVTLAAAVDVDVSVPDVYQVGVPLTPATVPAGSVVDSYFLHLDRVGTSGTPAITLSGTIEFANPIVGVVFSDAGLDASDAGLGAPGTVYGNHALRGLNTETGGDILEWTGNQLVLDLPITFATDQVRVLTEPSPEVGKQGITFSIDHQGPLRGAVPSFGPAPLDEGDILSVGAPAVPLNPPMVGAPTPGVFLPRSRLGGAAAGFFEVDALSYGRDVGEKLYFSVDEFAQGIPGAAGAPDVATEGENGNQEASGDVFAWLGAGIPAPPLALNGNRQVVDGNGFAPTGLPGLGLTEANPATPFQADPGDNLDALDYRTAIGHRRRVFFSLDAGFADPLEGAAPPNTDSAVAYGFAPGDVIVRDAAGLRVYIAAAQLGLGQQDDVDALAIGDDGDGDYEPAQDSVLFSLRRGSPILGVADCRLGIPIEESDVLGPPCPGSGVPAVMVRGEALGLVTLRSGLPLAFDYADDLDALDRVDTTGEPNPDGD